MTEPFVFLNGNFVAASQASIRIYDTAVVMGATVTEMTRTFGHKLFRLEDHVARLFRSLKYVRFDIGFSHSQLEEISRELVQRNLKLVGPTDELGLIHFISAGELPVYAGAAAGSAQRTPTVCAHTFPMPFDIWANGMKNGMHVVTPSIRHVPPQCYDPKMKYRSRMHYYLADNEARLVAPDAIALLLDLDGNITETSGANFLMVQDQVIVSPTTRNILPGVSRQTVIELAAQLGIPFVERDIQVHNVMNASEAFLASTPYCLMPVSRINGVAIGDGASQTQLPGPIYRQLIDAWSKKVGMDILAPFRGRI